MSDPREKLFYWDGRQREITEFMSELFDDPDEDDQDWKAVYKKNRVE
ncbi:MAG TPA: hypothetical protein VFD28_02995 [Candidatus Eisenbacteria bacterium]|nr:hypothetical protein [Candidatus Eisenbacteria bacterium]